MLLASAFGKKTVRCPTLVLLVGGFAALAPAQGLPKAPAPDARTIILPPKMVAGALATLAVLDSAGRLVPNAVVELSGGRKVTTDITGRALFLAPGEAGKLIAKTSGQATTVSSTVVAAADPVAQSPVEGDSAGVHLVSYPHFLTIHDRFIIDGSGFRGAADVNRVFLNDQPCLVIASSPVSLTVLPGPRIPIGATTLRVSVAGYDSGQIPVSVVSLEFSGPTDAPDAGTQGKIILSVRGATERLAVEVRNSSPAIIQFPHGNVQRHMTSGGEPNTVPVELKFLATGNYTVTAKLIPADSGSPPAGN